MDPPPICDLLDISVASRNLILDKYQLTEEDVKITSDKILEWFEDQPFMGKVSLDKKRIGNIIIQNKANFERTKQTLINHYFLKMAMPEIFSDRDTQLPEIRETLKALIFSFQFPLSKSGEHYVCFEFKDEAEKLDIEVFFKLYFMELDVKMRREFSSDLVVIVDASRVKQEHVDECVSKFRIFPLCVYACQQAYGQRIKAAHFVRPTAEAREFIKRLPALLTKDTTFAIHDDLASLHRSVEIELLPKSLGGNEDNIDEQQEKWLTRINENREWFLDEDKKYTEN